MERPEFIGVVGAGSYLSGPLSHKSKHVDEVRGRGESMSGSWPAFCRMKDLGSRFNQSDQSLNPFNGH